MCFSSGFAIKEMGWKKIMSFCVFSANGFQNEEKIQHFLYLRKTKNTISDNWK